MLTVRQQGALHMSETETRVYRQAGAEARASETPPYSLTMMVDVIIQGPKVAGKVKDITETMRSGYRK